jgi:thiamine biosynthesis protein ThiI
MLSGGIDSPVAAARMQQRGCYLNFVHFHSHPFVSRASIEKAEELGEILAQYQYDGVIHMVPFGELQREIVDNTPEGLRVILYRRFMVRIAAEIAKRHKARALVTGEALGQVASQTLTNMITVDEASPIPILRPLVGFDKHEIIEHAQRLKSYEISIIPDQDCCQLFMPKNPETHARLERVLEAEKNLDLEKLIEEALTRIELVEVRAPWWSDKKKRRQQRTSDTLNNINRDEADSEACPIAPAS